MNQFNDIIFKLKKAKGRRVPLADLVKGEKSSENVHKAKKSGKKRGSDQIDALLSDLEEFGLIKRADRYIEPSHPFFVDARLSASAAGLAFGMGTFKKDILIMPGKRAGANHRDRVWIELTSQNRDRYEGRVVSIIEPFATIFIAKITMKHPDGYIISLSDLPDKPAGLLRHKDRLNINDFVVVEESGETVDMVMPAPRDNRENNRSRNNKSLYQQDIPVYELSRRIAVDELESDTVRVALKYNIPITIDPKLVPPKGEMKKKTKEGKKDKERKNLTKLYACTIDGADSKDFDDAISLEIKKDRRILYVHIADVSHYIEKGSPLDKEALKRGNSYYLAKKVYPMLPPILSEEFCSLKPKTKRLAFTCEMHYDKEANLMEYHFYKSFISLKKRFTYETAEKDMDKKRSPLAPVKQLAEELNKKRILSGKLELNIKETQVVTDAHGRIIAMNDKIKLRSHSLVEECMLSANVCSAHFLKKNKMPALYRAHDPMPPDNIKKLNGYLKFAGINYQMKGSRFTEIQKVISLFKGTDKEEVFNILLLRSFSQAVYSPTPKGHWGLAFEDYTHFTSPIRRFSDLLVHRQIHAILKKKSSLYGKKEIEEIGVETSRLERIAMEAERALMRLMSVRYMKNNIGKSYSATITNFNQNGMYILLDEIKMEGFIPSERGTKREFRIVNDFSLFIPQGSKTVSPGTKVNVELTEASWEKMVLLFRLTSL